MSWIEQRRRDPYYRMSKEMGLPSRAAFKLAEVQSRWRVISRGDYVLDLGAAPGGITAAAAEEAGSRGLVVAVDMAEVKAVKENIRFVRADIYEEDLVPRLLAHTGGRLFDTIISDLSPKHTGDFELLVMQQLDLLTRAREISYAVLRRGGNLVMKSFEHPAMRGFERETARDFHRFERLVPKASPKGSAEIFQVYLGFRRGRP